MAKKNIHTLALGTEQTLTASSAIAIIESAIGEGITVSLEGVENNIFGRPLISQRAQSEGITFAMGLSSSGLRAHAVLKGKKMLREDEALSESVRRHLAFVIHLHMQNSGDHRYFHAVSDLGCIQFFASCVQDAVDLTILAHKLSELCLSPVMVAIDYGDSIVEKVIFPEASFLQTFLGQGDDFMDAPTPSQKMIFGKSRRRIPNWFHYDFPTIQGVDKQGRDQTFELAAQQAYFGSHTAEMAIDLFKEYGKLTGRANSPIASHKIDDAEYVLLVQGPAYHRAVSVVDQLRSKRIKAGALHLRMVRPFPGKELCELLTGKKGLTILEQVAQPLDIEPPIFRDVASALDKAAQNAGKKKNLVFSNFPAMSDRERPVMYSGQYGSIGTSLSEAEINKVFENMMESGRRRFFVGFDFSRAKSSYPKQHILLQNINRDYPEALSFSLQPGLPNAEDSAGPHHEKTAPAELPLSLRQYEDHGPPYSRVSQFYDRTGVFYQTDATEEIVADPFQSLPVTPVATANFISNSRTREMVPEFIASKCTGCGQCSVYCPESAMPPIVISAEALVKSAIDRAQADGIAMTQWTPPAVKNFSKLMNQALSVLPENMTAFSDLLHEALKKLATQMKLEGGRLQMLREQFNLLLPSLVGFQAAVTKKFFTDPERQAKGSGLLFSAAVNPQSCTGCGICADVCKDEALIMSKEDRDRTVQLQSRFRLWEQLPDTSGDVIQKMVKDDNYDSFAAIMLSRNYYMSMAGGFGSEKNSNEKVMTHLVASAAESIMQSTMNKQIQEIELHIKALSEKIQNKLREALPTDNFDNLISSLSGSEYARVSLDTVIKKLSETQRFGTLETSWMERIVSLINDLKTLTWALSKGPTGVGRSRFGTVVSSVNSMEWAKQFPYNAFTSPVVIYDHPDSMNFIHGLCHGHIRQMLENIKLLRRAELEAQNEYDPAIDDERIANLNWNQLTENEKTFVPPVFVMADYKMMLESSLPSLLGLLSSDLPIKIIFFDSADGAAEYWQGRMAITTAALSLRKTFLLQSSLANPDHLFKGLMDGLRLPMPSFFHVLTPRGDVFQEVYKLALQSRAFPLFRFAPSAKKKTFSTAFDMNENPEPYGDFVSVRLEQEKDGGITSHTYIMTFADWAFQQRELEKHFVLMDDAERRGIPVNEYILMAPDSRSDKIPFILRPNDEGKLVKYAISETIAKAAEAANTSWNTLREMAGMVTPYPEKLKERIDEEWAAKQASALEQAKAEYEEKLKQQENTQLEQIKKKLSDKLMALSGYGNPS